MISGGTSPFYFLTAGGTRPPVPPGVGAHGFHGNQTVANEHLELRVVREYLVAILSPHQTILLRAEVLLLFPT